jgi:hypothetical protein
MKKGCNEEIAARRVIQMWGSSVPPSIISKSDDIADQFQGEVYKIAERDGCTLTDATQQARRENPRLMKFLR